MNIQKKSSIRCLVSRIAAYSLSFGLLFTAGQALAFFPNPLNGVDVVIWDDPTGTNLDDLSHPPNSPVSGGTIDTSTANTADLVIDIMPEHFNVTIPPPNPGPSSVNILFTSNSNAIPDAGGGGSPLMNNMKLLDMNGNDITPAQDQGLFTWVTGNNNQMQLSFGNPFVNSQLQEVNEIHGLLLEGFGPSISQNSIFTFTSVTTTTGSAIEVGSWPMPAPQGQAFTIISLGGLGLILLGLAGIRQYHKTS